MKDPSIKLRNKFYRELPEYDELLARQGGVCKICGRPPHKNKLSVDHDHAVDKVKIVIVERGKNYWFAKAIYHTEVFAALKPTRKDAWEAVKIQLFRRAIRGLLCFLCNGGIQHFEDSKAPLKPAERFDRAAAYFREFENGPGNGSTS